LGIPEIGGIGFHAQQRIIRTLAAVAWIVAHLGAILMAKTVSTVRSGSKIRSERRSGK
jgi:hypothetical protein